MSGGIAVGITLGDELTQALRRAREAALDLTGPMKAIAAHLETTTILRFEDERGPDGVPWKPSQRVLDNPGSKTLQLRGHLKDSIQANSGRDFAEVGPANSGGPAIYAAIHQFGGTIKPRTKGALSFAGRVVAAVRIPARPYLGFTDENREEAIAAIRDHLYAAFISGGGAPAVPE